MQAKRVYTTRNQGRRQKNFRGGTMEKRPKNSKKRPKNSTFKPLSTIFVPCMKIQGGPTAMQVINKLGQLKAHLVSKIINHILKKF